MNYVITTVHEQLATEIDGIIESQIAIEEIVSKREGELKMVQSVVEERIRLQKL